VTISFSNNILHRGVSNVASVIIRRQSGGDEKYCNPENKFVAPCWIIGERERERDLLFV